MKETSKQILKYLNLAREHPAYYVSLLDKQIESFINDREMPLTNQIIYETNDGKDAWIEARRFLLQQKPLPPLISHSGLTKAAEDHQADICLNGIFGHQGSDGSTFSQRILRYCKKGPGAMAEIIGADFDLQERNTYEMTILGLIVDDGVKDRGHRKTIYNPNYKFVGHSSGKKDEKFITVFNLTERNLDLINSQNKQAETLNSNFSKSLEWNNGNKQFSDITNKMKNGFSTGPFNMKVRKMTEKRQNIRTYFQDGAKVIETTTKVIFNDGSVEENTEKRTIYTE